MRFLMGFLLGLCAGGAIGLLMTPQPGNAMRQVIAYQARQRAEQARQRWQARREQEAETV